MEIRNPFTYAVLFLIGIANCWIVYVTLTSMKPLAFKRVESTHGLLTYLELNSLLLEYKDYGGMYMDLDQVALGPVELLRHYQHTQALEYSGSLGSQFIMARRNSTFLRHWYDGYRTAYRTEWAWNAQWYPIKLSNRYPNLIHIEGNNFTRHRHQIHKENYDWSPHYGMHMFARFFNNTIDLKTVRRLNTTVGSISRHILFGNKGFVQCKT